MKSEHAESLGLYKLLTDLETEWTAWSKNILLYPSIVADAIIIAIHKVREQISVFESIDAEQAAIEGQLQLNHELNEAVEMKVSA